MNNTSSVNTKYKTAMCRHWEQTGNCQLGPKCHFAHGKDDLRSMGDPLPLNAPSRPQNLMQKPFQKPTYSDNNFSNNSNGGSFPSNYKTSLCKYFEKGSCKYEGKCNFAHGESELRQGGGKPRTMGPSGGSMGGTGGGMGGRGGGMNPLINRGMMMSNQGPSYQQMSSPYQQMGSPYQQMSSPYQQSTGPYQQTSSPMMQQQQTSSPMPDTNMQNYVAQMQIALLIQHLENYHSDDQKITLKIQLAKEQLQQSNVSGAAMILNEITQREDKSTEDEEAYSQFITSIQQYGMSLSSAPYQSQTMNGGGPSGGMRTMGGPTGYSTGGYSPMQQSPTQSYSPMTQQSGGMIQSSRR